MDAITLLKNDHKTVKRLFREFNQMGDRARASKRQAVDRIIEELSAHSVIEEQLFYPFVRDTVKGAEEDVLESLEEHHVVKWTLSELQNMDPTHERFDAKVKVLEESVLHHVKEEEEELFPRVREAAGRKELQELGASMEQAKKMAPTRPHPRSPDTPPGNLVSGPAAAVADRAWERGRDAWEDARGKLSSRFGRD